ncbi:hypothetical protein [Larkinella terrae]|uniref:Uncharacterized protein n=1 Tax=Larkinella terrae TaxID=2025311 RepID=A0A7K0EDK1_9BACT|nr:hypothetical protein [Larkinella terrae]MRS59855.1 hypothetical protein [Larkinella terrae]
MPQEKGSIQPEKPKMGTITEAYLDIVDQRERADPTFDRQMLADLSKGRPQRLQAYLKKQNLTYLHLLIVEKEDEETIEVTTTDGTGAKSTRIITPEEEALLKPQALFIQRIVFEDFTIGRPFSLTTSTETKRP